MKKVDVKIIRRLDSDFIEEWSKLVNCSEHAHFFNTPQWFISCLDTYDINEYYIFAAYQKDELVGVLPLIKERKFAVEVFASPGKRYLEKSTLLLKGGSTYILDSLISEILKNGDIYLTEVSEEMAGALFKSKKSGLLTLSSINPFINLKSNPLGSLSKKQKKKIEGKIRKDLNNLKFGHYRNNLGFHLQNVFELETRSSKKLAHKDSFSNKYIRNLFANLIHHAKQNVIVNFVYFKNVPIVSSFGFVFKDTYHAYHTSYDKNFRHLIPGKLLTFNMLLKLRQEGVHLFDFTRGHNIFKSEFTKSSVFQYDFYFSKNSLIRAWWEGINSLRRLRQLLIKNSNSLDSKFLFRVFAKTEGLNPRKKRIRETNSLSLKGENTHAFQT